MTLKRKPKRLASGARRNGHLQLVRDTWLTRSLVGEDDELGSRAVTEVGVRLARMKPARRAQALLAIKKALAACDDLD